MPSQTFRHSAHSAAPQASVWASLDEVETWERIPGVDSVVSSERDEAGALKSFSFQAMVGGRPYLGRATLLERTEPERVSWRIESPDLGGSVAVGLAPDGAGTTVTVELTVTVDGFLASMFFPVITGALGRGFPEAVEEFAASFQP